MDERFSASFADTGVWRLIIYMSHRGISAFLRNTEEPSASPVALFAEQWKADQAPLLPKIENCVYDNPRLLDDYATEIILETAKSLQMPVGILEQEEGLEERLFSQVYPTEPDNLFMDRSESEIAMYTLAPGLPAFIRRTLPGARVTCHLSVLKEYFRNHAAGRRIYCDIRPAEADILAFDGKNLTSASTHGWQESADIAYRLMLLMKAYELTADDTEIWLTGLPGEKSELSDMLRQMGQNVNLYPEPAPMGEISLPLAAAISLS